MGRTRRFLAGILAVILAFGSDSIIMAANTGMPEMGTENIRDAGIKDNIKKEENKETEVLLEAEKQKTIQLFNEEAEEDDLKFETVSKSVKQKSTMSLRANSNDLISSDGYYTYTLNGDEATVTGYNDEDTNIIILPSAIDGHKLTGIGAYAFAGHGALTNISLPDSLSYIGACAFQGTGIESITIPKNVKSSGGNSYDGAMSGATSLKKIVFEDGMTKIPDYICASGSNSSYVTEIVIPGSVSEIGSYAFSSCISLREVDIPKSVSGIGTGAFGGCTSLTGITMHYNDSMINTETQGTQPFRATVGGNAFSGCSKLTDVELSENVTSIGNGAFSGCTKLETLTLPESLTYLGQQVIKGTWISSITIPKNVKSSGGNSYDGAMSGATSLKKIVFEDGMTKIPDYICASGSNSSYVTEIVIPGSVSEIGSYAFSSCISLREVDIPKSVSGIGTGAFGGCTSLTGITMHYNDSMINTETQGTQPFRATVGGNAFSGCSKLTDVELSENVTSIGNGAFSGCTKLETLTLPESLTYLGQQVIKGTWISSITIPKNVKSSGGNSYDGAMSGATSLKKIVFEDGMTKIPDYICASGSNSSYVTEIVIPGSVSEIGSYAFSSCISLREVDIPKSVSGIGTGAFGGCTSLTGITMHYNDSMINTETQGTQPFRATVGGNAFSGCSKLTDVELSENVTSIGNGAFSGCTKLETLTLPESLTYLGQQVIKGTWISSITIPKNVKSSGGNSYDGAMSGATSLKKIVFEDGMTKIPDYICASGSYSSYITAAFIPRSVTEIGNYAFYKCENLVIYGYEDSYAKTYADENNIPFKNASEFDFGSGDDDPKDGDTIVGILEEASHADRTLTVSGKKYSVSDDFSIPDAGNIIAGSGDKHVICSVKNGIIVKLVRVSDVLEPDIFITTEGDDITYQNGEFTTSSQKIKVHVSCKINGTYPIDTFWDSDIKMYIDSFKLTIQDDGINFGKKGVFNKEEMKYIDQNVNKDVLVGRSTTYDFTVNVNDGYEPSPVNKQKLKIKATATAASQTAEHEYGISMINLDYQRQIAEQKKAEQTAKSSLSKAQQELQKLCNGDSLATTADMMYYMDSQQIKSLEAYLYTWLAEVNNANTFTDDSKITDKIMDKLGIDKKVAFLWLRTKATTYFKATTVYGERTFEITLDFGGLQSDGTTYAGFGDMKYEVLDKNGIPGNIPTKGTFGLETYVSMKDFTECLKSVAESSVKKAFNESWGKYVNEIADMVVDKTIIDVINDKCGSFSNGIYTLITKPAKSYVKKMKVACPVDVYVYDMDGNLCGSIINNVVDDSNAEIAMSVQGDTKTFYLTGNDYSIKLVGNDKGTMTYTVEELDENLQNLRTITFNNLSLDKGTTYKGFVMEPVYIDNALYSLEKDGKDMIYSDTDTYQDALTKNLVEGISLSVSEQSLQQDTALQLIATVYPETAANKSIRWESDNEQVAIVDDTGLVTAVGIGEAVVTAKSRDGSNILAACKIAVTNKSGDNTTDDTTGDNTSGGDTTGDNTLGGGSSGGSTSGSGSIGGSTSGGGSTGGSTSGGGSTGGSTSGGSSTGGNTSGSASTGGSTPGNNTSGNGADNNDNTSENNKPDNSMQIKLLYYIIEFNENSGTKLSRKTMTLLNDDNLGILPKVQRKNYTFNGWYTQKSGGTKVNSSTVLNAGTTLFAQWTKVNKPSKVKAPTLKSKKAGQAAVSFKKVSGAKGYEIAYSTNKKFLASSTKKTVSASVKKTLEKLKSGRKYYVRVRAYKVDSAGKKVYGAYSQVKSIKVK